jgi:hypothetical protein
MLTYNKMMKLHNELSSSLNKLRQHLEFVLGDMCYEYEVSAQIRVEECNNLTIGFYDPTRGMEFEALISDEKEFKQMLKFQTAEELLPFLSQRTIA